jgi:F-type H+-transporting ATPase subunit epsilon
MATFQFDLVSPEKLVFSGEVEQVDIPGTEGDFGVLAGHSPVVAAIRPGIMTVTANGRQTKVVVLGGLAEVSATGLTVLADVATSVEDIDRAAFAKTVKDMEAAIAQMAQGTQLDKEIARLDHFRTVQQHIEGTAMH